LQAADEPGADVGEALVVQVDRVLGGHQHAQAEGAGLLEQADQRLLARRVHDRREVAVDLVDVEQRPQAGRAALVADPGQQRFQNQRHDEHALGVVEVRGIEDGDARLAFRRIEQALDVHRHAFQPGAEGRRGHNVVEGHRQGEAVFLGEVLLHRQHAQLLEGRLLNLRDQRFQGEVLAGAPVVLEDVGQQDVLRILERLGADADQGEDGRDRAGDLLAQRLLVAGEAFPGGAQRGQDAHRQAAGRAGGVDGVVGGALEALHPLRGDAPVGQPGLPLLGGLGGLGGDVVAFALRFVLADPRLKVCRPELREVQQQVADIPFGVDDEGRDAVQDRLLQQGDAQAGFAAAGHAQHQTVGGQVPRIVVNDLVFEDFVRCGVVKAANVEVGRRVNKSHGVRSLLFHCPMRPVYHIGYASVA